MQIRKINIFAPILIYKNNVKIDSPMALENKLGISYYDVIEQLRNENLCTSNVGGYPDFYQVPDVYYNAQKDICLLYLELYHENGFSFGTGLRSFHLVVSSEDLLNLKFENYYCNFDLDF